MGFHGMEGAGGLEFPVPPVAPGDGGVVEPLMIEMSSTSRSLEWDHSATEPLSEMSARRDKGDPSWDSNGFWRGGVSAEILQDGGAAWKAAFELAIHGASPRGSVTRLGLLGSTTSQR
jgi:hypothetical protein